MTFEELRKVAKNGDVISYRGEGFLPWLVRYWTKTEVAHVGFVIWLRFGIETADRMCLLHSHPFGGINIVPIVDTLGGVIYYQRITRKGDEAIGYALEQWGKRYASLWQFILMMSPWLREKWEALGLSVGDGSRYHCSQLVSEAIQFATGFTLPKASAEMTPADVMALPCLDAKVQVM